jgi:hypothetical protein
MSFELVFDKLHTFRNGRQFPVRDLDMQSRTHIHGALRVIIDGRELPSLGYFGSADVCIGMWTGELLAARQAVLHDDPSEYLFDEGEQGQPAFLFQREGASIHTSVVDSAISGAVGDSDWRRVPCTVEEFVGGLDQFLTALHRSLATELKPSILAMWWKRNVEDAAPKAVEADGRTSS